MPFFLMRINASRLVQVSQIIIKLIFCQITQEDIKKTYGGSSGSRGYYSSAFARLVIL